MVKGAVGWRHLEEVDNGEKVWVEEEEEGEGGMVNLEEMDNGEKVWVGEGEGGMVHHQTMNLGLLEEEEREGEGEEEKEAGSLVEEGGVISRRGVGEDSPREGGGAAVDMEETTEEDLVWLEEAREEEGLGKSVEYEEHMEVRVLRYDSKMNNSKRFLLGVTVGLTRGAELDGGVLPGEYEEG